jgi:DNA-binding winged helix-turn-helix (wHTH) protein
MKYRVADAIVDFDENRIERADRSIELEPRVADVLRYLITRPGELVTREKLLDDVWNTQNISDDVVTRCINLIRRSFDDSPRNPRVLQTLTKRGYRLIAEVRPLDGAPLTQSSRLNVVRLPAERALRETTAACFIRGGAAVGTRIENFLAVDMRRTEGAGSNWRGRTYSASVRETGEDVVLRLRQPAFTLALPLIAAPLALVLAWMTLRGIGAGSEWALPSGQILAGSILAALVAGGLAWLLKDRIDERSAHNLEHRRDAILAAALRD